ncbi:MAG: hypothetical protein GY716_08740 [bacterium]|nr:hypothetical protein [bacterium]
MSGKRAILAVSFLAFVAAAVWVYDATSYGFSLIPEFMLDQPAELQLREMIRRFDRIKKRHEQNGDAEATREAVHRFRRELSTQRTNHKRYGATRRAEKLFQETREFESSLR